MEKKSQVISRFCDNCIIKSGYKLALIRKEYLLSGLNSSRNIPKMLHITQRDFLILNCTLRDQ